MKIKYGIIKFLIIFLILAYAVVADTVNNSGTDMLCLNEEILSESEKNTDYNLLSFPAISTDDPYILAISYFNSKLNIIVRENYITQYEYAGVPYLLYKSFLNSKLKKEYYESCIKDHYESIKVY